MRRHGDQIDLFAIRCGRDLPCGITRRQHRIHLDARPPQLV